MVKIESFRHLEWQKLNHLEIKGVLVMSLQATETFALSMLRFEKDAHIHEHDADYPIDVYCLEGSGIVRLGGKEAPIRVGQRVHWEKGVLHQLRTTESHMVTLMFEHLDN